MKWLSLSLYLEDKKGGFIDNCTLCGQCVMDCPAIPFTELKDYDPQDIQEKTLELLRDNKPSKEAYIRAYSCMECLTCFESCPQELDPHLINMICRANLVRCGQEAPRALKFALPQNRFNFNSILSSIQIKPSEVRWLREVPSGAEAKDVVLFLGCGIHIFPDEIFTLLDIFQQMEVDFVTLGGIDFCCGIPNLLVGDVEGAEKMARRLIQAIDSFKPRKVIFICPGCIEQFQKIISQFLPLPWELQFVTQFLTDNFERLGKLKPVERKVTLQDPCPLVRGNKKADHLRKILRAIPAVELIEMEHNKENCYCCGGGALASSPMVARQIRDRRLEEAKSTGAEVLLECCPGCHLTFMQEEYRFPFQAQTLISLLGKAMDIHYDAKLRRYFNSGDYDKVMHEAREYIQESEFTEEELHSFLSKYFNR